jgi:hypothetical protein
MVARQLANYPPKATYFSTHLEMKFFILQRKPQIGRMWRGNCFSEERWCHEK